MQREGAHYTPAPSSKTLNTAQHCEMALLRADRHPCRQLDIAFCEMLMQSLIPAVHTGTTVSALVNVLIVVLPGLQR